jgi:hypothetical protein
MEKDKKTIKTDILNKFKELDQDVGGTLPRIWLRKDYVARLSQYEKIIFDKAVTELATNGLVEYTPGTFPTVKLTQKGERLIGN